MQWMMDLITASTTVCNCQYIKSMQLSYG